MTVAEEGGASRIHHLGDGYEPHVDEYAGKLHYLIPVDSGFASRSFDFEIARADLAVLLADPYRRAVLEVTAHVLLQHSMQQDVADATQELFRDLLDRALHSPPERLKALIDEVDRTHKAGVNAYVQQILQRRAGAKQAAG